MKGIKTLKLMLKRNKHSKEDLNKVEKQLEEQKECPFCSYQKTEIKNCCEQHDVKNSVKSVSFHIIKCSDCRNRVQLMAQCKKKGHR